MTDNQDQVQDTMPNTEESTTAEPTQNSGVRVEEFKVSGDDLMDKVKDLVNEGNVRRILIKTDQGQTLLEIPLTVGLVGGAVGVVLFPFVAAIAAIGALVAKLTLVIEKQTS